MAPGDRRRGNGHKLKHVNMRMSFFTVRVTAHWNKVAQGGCGVSFPGDIQEPSGHNHE